MELFHALVCTDEAQTIRFIRWINPHEQNFYEPVWNTFPGRNFYEVFQSVAGRDGQELLWNGERFLCTALEQSDGTHYYLKHDDNRLLLLERAMDFMNDGIQVYDQDARLVYLNNSSRTISNVPANMHLEGRHLQDIYDLSDDVSTVMTALRTRAPVINRFDSFQPHNGSNICSTNTAYPIFQGGELLGVVVFEQDSRVVDEQLRRLEVIRERLRQTTENKPPYKFTGYTFGDVIGSGKALRDAVELAKRVAQRDSNIMLVGETGTGKEIFAQSIHKASSRAGKRFVAVNCAAIPETLAESFFFGTQKGSYTGSVDKAGLLEEANGGTLFLDELNSMNLLMQSKLLRALQEGTFRRVGGERDIKANIRVISSTNEPPDTLVSGNALRKDLFYRLSTVMIVLPPLREHPDDIPELVEYYIGQNLHHFTKSILSVSPETLAILERFPWPGNVRELFHVLDYVMNVVDSDEIRTNHLPQYIREGDKPATSAPAESGDAPDDPTWYQSELQDIMDTYEAAVLRRVLQHYHFNITRTADALGIRRQSLQYRINKYGIVF